MPRILAVDDSATMRRVLELTFAGQDGIEIVAVHDGPTAVRAAGAHKLDLILADASMAGMDGYDLAKAIRDAGNQAPIILMASQHTPFDAERARASGIDDHVLKPFDTQSMIDKAKDVMSRGRRASAAPGPRSATSSTMQSTPAAPRPAVAAVGSPVAAAPKPVHRPTANFGPGSTAPATAPTATLAPAPAAPARAMVPPSAVVAARPAPAAPASPAMAAKKPVLELAEDEHAAHAAAAPVAAATAAATAEMAGKLGGMGLTPEQVQGILALSREVIERVVWEVVPDLAETIIREEIKRLTS